MTPHLEERPGQQDDRDPGSPETSPPQGPHPQLPGSPCCPEAPAAGPQGKLHMRHGGLAQVASRLGGFGGAAPGAELTPFAGPLGLLPRGGPWGPEEASPPAQSKEMGLEAVGHGSGAPRPPLTAHGAAGAPGAQRQHPPVPVPVGSPPWICGKSTPVRSPAMSPQLLLGTMRSPPQAPCGQLGWARESPQAPGLSTRVGRAPHPGGAAGVGTHHEVADGPVEDGAVVVSLLAEPDEVLTGFRRLKQAKGPGESHRGLGGGKGSRGPQPGLGRCTCEPGHPAAALGSRGGTHAPDRSAAPG